jgi:uncharacterized protein involved in exopolysaccharide biosynthesis
MNKAVGNASGATGSERSDAMRALRLIGFRGYRLYVGAFALSIALTAVYLHVKTPKYTANVTLIASSPDPLSKVTEMSSALGGLAGLSLGHGNSDFSEFIALLDSGAVADRIFDNSYLVHNLFRGQWNKRAKRWRTPSVMHRALSWIEFVLSGRRRSDAPSPYRIREILVRRLNIAKRGENPIWTVSFSDRDKSFARRLLMSIVGAANDIILDREAERSSVYYRYLQQRLKSTQSVYTRNALSALAVKVQEREILAISKQGVPARIVSGPTVPDSPDSPSILKTFLFLVIGGQLAAFGYRFMQSRSITKLSESELRNADRAH